jgi:hypothetical protein
LRRRFDGRQHGLCRESEGGKGDGGEKLFHHGRALLRGLVTPRVPLIGFDAAGLDEPARDGARGSLDDRFYERHVRRRSPAEGFNEIMEPTQFLLQ